MSHRVEAYFRDLAGVRSAVAVTTAEGTLLSFGESVELVIMQALAAHGNGRKLIFIGNGGSSAIASHMAIDYWKNGGIRATAFNDAALLTCLSNDYGYEQVFAKPIEMMSQAGDLLIAISSSGRSLNILNGVAAARKNGCGVVTFSGFAADNPLRSLGNINFYVPSESYGYVEITHLSICHSILDLSVGLKGRRDPQD